MSHTIISLVQDRPGTLNRITSAFRRREINIESLSVSKTEEPGVSRLTMTFEADNPASIMRQLEKLIDVFEVSLLDKSSATPLKPSTPTLGSQADGIA